MVSFVNLTDGGEQIIAELDRILSIILGRLGVTGVIAQFNVEPMELKNDLGTATHPKRVDTTVLLSCNLTPKLVITDPAQLTEDGEIGVIGANALFLVEVAKILELVPAIVLPQNMVVPIALEMPPKWELVTKILAQSTEDSVTGTNGLLAPWNVEEEIKQETDDVTILSQNSVDWNASAIFQNANVVTWIHVHLNAQHNHFKS